MLVLLRVQIGTRFTLVTGDIYDGRIELSLLLHWFNVLRGVEAWNQTAYFWPYPDTLGYNDGYLLFGLLFRLLHGCGLEPMLSSELVNIAVRLVGYGAFLAVAVEVAGLPLQLATLGAVLFSISNGMYVQEVHAQLLTVCFAPLLLWLLARCWRCLAARPPRAALFGSAAAILYGSWLLTGFYMAWFTAFFGILWLAALALCARFQGRSGREAFRRLACWPVALSLGVLALSVVPFLIVYLPTAAQTGQHPFYLAREGLATLRDLLRVGPGNLLFGWFDPALNGGWAVHPAASTGEAVVGYPPFLWLTAIAGAVLLFRRDRRHSASPLRIEWQAMALAVLAAMLCCLDIQGGMAWHVVYKLVPGAAALRTQTRLLLFLDAPVVLLAMLAMHHLSQRVQWPIMAGIAALLVVGELTTQDAQALNRTEERESIDAIPAADPDCQAFVVVSRGFQASYNGFAMDRLYHHTVDAMVLAEERALPTLNGFATFVPPDVAAINRLPVAPATIDAFMRRHHRQDTVCALDLDQRRWLRSPPPQPPALPMDGLRFADADADRFLVSGWSHPEQQGRWTDGRAATVRMTVPEDFSDRMLRLDLQALPFFPPGRSASAIRVTANGQLIERWLPQPGQESFVALIPAGLPGLPSLTLQFLIQTPMTPRQTDGTPDDRALGLRFGRLSIRPASREP